MHTYTYIHAISNFFFGISYFFFLNQISHVGRYWMGLGGRTYCRHLSLSLAISRSLSLSLALSLRNRRAKRRERERLGNTA